MDADQPELLLLVYAAMVMVLMAFCPTGVIGLIDRIIKVFTARPAPAAMSLPAQRTDA